MLPGFAWVVEALEDMSRGTTLFTRLQEDSGKSKTLELPKYMSRTIMTWRFFL